MMIQVPCSTVLFRQADPGSEMTVAFPKSRFAYSWQSSLFVVFNGVPLETHHRVWKKQGKKFWTPKTWIQRCGPIVILWSIATLPETNIAPEHSWLEDCSLFMGRPSFRSYCWWKKSCTTCYLWNPCEKWYNVILHINWATGTGFLPSAVCWF